MQYQHLNGQRQAPQPTGTFSAKISNLAPQLVPCSRKDVTNASKRGTASTSPQKMGYLELHSNLVFQQLHYQFESHDRESKHQIFC